VDFHHSVEMSLSREEFLRLLPAAAGPFTAEGSAYHGRDQHRDWRIRIVPLADRRVGSVVVPRHRVEIVIQACSEDESEAFMARFHRAFLRGGG
jgi:hypothetical protein